jgi:protein-disulfide isomerase
VRAFSRRALGVCSLFLLCLVAAPRWAQADTCANLSAPQRKLANELLDSQHAYDCCDKTLSQCLKRKPVCSLVVRLSQDVCRRVAAGQKRPDIERELARRATSMMPTATPRSIDTKSSVGLGSKDAKVTAVVYVCPRCPFCARLMPALAASVRSGNLAGKVQLYARIFPLRSHEYSTDAALGVMAAEKLGKFWEYLLELHADFDASKPPDLAKVAEKVGLDVGAHAQAMKSPEVRQKLVDAKKEGVRNLVEATPSLFINGRPYTGDPSEEAIEDVLEEEYERVTGKSHK